MDFVKENLFNILNNYFYFEDISVLDLFAGTGSVTYEFASRGTTNITTVEKNKKCIDFIRQTLKELHFDDVRLIRADAIKFIEDCNDKYDVIFADPPFEFLQTEIIPDIVFKKNLLKADGWLVIQTRYRSNDDFSNHPNFYEIRKYGQNVLNFFRK